ncbi:hypothetical protein HZC32_01065, partial [Candidatus Woesearchaeota archaeon]|nr:hypothetical protein [Candidatus Woesearchaeota archaeon]
FIMQGEGQEVMNYTLKTNFKLPQCREAIEKLTGQKLTFNSSVQDYVEAIATFKPGEKNIYSVQDIVSTLRNVQPQHAFVDEQNSLITTWDMVARAIDQKEELYNFEEKTVRAIADFVIFAKEGNHTKEELQKAIAATILRMSDLFFRPDEQKVMQPSIWYELCSNPLSFGKVLEKAAERRGCSGGGDSVAVSSLVTRAGSLGEDQYGARAFNCPECGKMNLRPQGELLSACQHCGSKAVAC